MQSDYESTGKGQSGWESIMSDVVGADVSIVGTTWPLKLPHTLLT